MNAANLKRRDRVLKLAPFERLVYWIKERHQIYVRRKQGKPKPWTTDEIMLDYKFCNPVRMNDRVSQWLLHNWYTPYKNHPNMLLACTLARQINTPDALAAVNFPIDWDPDRVQHVLEDRAANGLKNYSAAYMITANFGKRGRASESKPYQTVWRVCNPIFESGVKPNNNSMEQTWQSLLGFQGFSSFIAGQVTADLRYAVDGPWTDRNTWAPMGPGSQRGMNRLHNRPKDSKLEQPQFEKELKELFSNLSTLRYLPVLEAMDVQSCLCEFDKYERIRLGEGRTKCYYNGRS